MANKAKVLFFIAGPVPTKEERAAFEKVPGAVFRNAAGHDPEHTPEECEAVAGCAPAEYLAKFKKIDEAPAAKK